MQHTEQCRRRFAEATASKRAFALAHPAACPTCHGWGGMEESYDPSPAGVGLSPGTMTDWSPCPDCLEGGICPYCAQTLYCEATDPGMADPPFCTVCGWVLDASPGCPAPPECGCWEEPYITAALDRVLGSGGRLF